MPDECYICFSAPETHRHLPIPLPTCPHKLPIPCGLPWLAHHNSCPECRAVIPKTPVKLATLVTANDNNNRTPVHAWFANSHRAGAIPGYIISTGRGLLFRRTDCGPGPRWRMFTPVAAPEYTGGGGVLRNVVLECNSPIANATLWLALYVATPQGLADVFTHFALAPTPREAWPRIFVS